VKLKHLAKQVIEEKIQRLTEVDYEEIFSPETMSLLKKQSKDELVKTGKNLAQMINTSSTLIPELIDAEQPHIDLLEEIAKEIVTQAYPIIKYSKIKINASGAHYYFEGKHYIAIDEKLPIELGECTFVHECLHAILRTEGYPCAYVIDKGDMNSNMRNSLANISGFVTDAIHHPEIYRRMSANYNLDIKNYFDKVVEAKVVRLKNMQKSISNNIEYIYSSQQNFIDAVEYFFYPTIQKETIFNELKNNFIDNYQSINNIKESKLNFNTPKNAILSIDFILEKIKKYAVSRDAEILNKQVWNRIVIK
jgi:hypothetical protein